MSKSITISHKISQRSYTNIDKDQTDPLSLIEQAKEGDSEAFGMLYEMYFVPVYRYIYSRLGDKTTAEDLAQTTFIKIFESLQNFKNIGKSPIAYFFTVARNTLYDYFKKKKDVLIGMNVADNEEDSNFFDRIEDEAADTVQNYKSREKQKRLHLLVDTHLEGLQKEVIYLKFIKELNNNEIAQIIGKKEDAIRQIQCRAIKKLRSHMESAHFF